MDVVITGGGEWGVDEQGSLTIRVDLVLVSRSCIDFESNTFGMWRRGPGLRLRRVIVPHDHRE